MSLKDELKTLIKRDSNRPWSIIFQKPLLEIGLARKFRPVPEGQKWKVQDFEGKLYFKVNNI